MAPTRLNTFFLRVSLVKSNISKYKKNKTTAITSSTNLKSATVIIITSMTIFVIFASVI